MQNLRKELLPGELVKQGLESLLLPTEAATVQVNGHQKGNSAQVMGDRLADGAAKQTSLDLIPHIPRVALTTG